MVCDGMAISSMYAAISYILGSESKFRKRLAFDSVTVFEKTAEDE